MVSQSSGFASHMQSIAAQASGAFGSMGSSIASHVGNMVSSVGRGVVSMGSSIIGAIEGFGRFVFFAKYAAEAAMGFGQALLGQNANMEQSRVAFTGLLGSGQAADAMLRRLWNFAATTPFEFPQLVQDTQELIGMGFAARDVIPVLTAVGDAAAGVGRGREGVDRITLALGQMQARGKVTGQDMLQLTEAGIPAWKILAQSMGLTVEQVQNLSQQGKLGADSVTALWHGMESMYTDQMKNQAQTFNGLLSTLHDNAMMALMTFSGPIFNMAKGALSSLTTLAGSPAFSAFAKTLGQDVAQGIASVVNFIKQAVQWFGQFGPQVDQVKTAFGHLGAALAPVANDFQRSGTASTILRGALDGLKFVIIAVATIISTLANGIASVIQWFNSGSPAVQRLGGMFNQLGSIISSAFIPVWKELQASWSEIVAAIQPILPQLRAVGILIAGVVVVAIVLLISIIGGLLVALGGVLTGLVRIVTGVIVFVSGIVQACSGFVQLISDLFTGHFERIGADLERIMMGIATMFGGIMLIISGIFQVGWSIIVGFATGFVQTLVALFNGLYQTLVGGSIIPDMCNAIVAAFTGMVAFVIGIVLGFVDRVIYGFESLYYRVVVYITILKFTLIAKFFELKAQGEAIVQSLVNSISNIFGTLGGIATNAGNAIINGLVGAINAGVGWVGAAVNNVVSTIRNLLPGSPAKEGPLRDIPKFGPGLTEGFAAGIIKGIPAVRAAVSMMVEPIPRQVTGQVNASAPSVIAAGRGGGNSARSEQRPIIIQFGNAEIRGLVQNLGRELSGTIIVQKGGLR